MSEAVRKAAEALLAASDKRALRGRDHVPAMRDEQDARSALRRALDAAPAPSCAPGEVERNLEAQRQAIEACARVADRMEGGLNIAGAIRRLAPNAALSPQGLDAKEVEMSPEECRLEDLKQMAAYAGPIVSFDVREPYYLASCDRCGWVGSSELCGTDSWGDDSDVYCPRCHAAGADCGKVAEKIATEPHQHGGKANG